MLLPETSSFTNLTVLKIFLRSSYPTKIIINPFYHLLPQPTQWNDFLDEIQDYGFFSKTEVSFSGSFLIPALSTFLCLVQGVSITWPLLENTAYSLSISEACDNLLNVQCTLQYVQRPEESGILVWFIYSDLAWCPAHGESLWRANLRCCLCGCNKHTLQEALSQITLQGTHKLAHAHTQSKYINKQGLKSRNVVRAGPSHLSSLLQEGCIFTFKQTAYCQKRKTSNWQCEEGRAFSTVRIM